MKISWKDLKDCMSFTPEELVGKHINDFKHSVHVGWYYKKGANWAYGLSAIIYKNKIIFVVQVNGFITKG